MNRRNASWLALGALVGGISLLPAVAGADDRLVVHEWGTFTSLQDEEGRAIGGINTDDEPVPKFVHDLHQWLLIEPTEVPPIYFQGAPSCHPDVTIRLETPVVYFHPSNAQTKVPPFDVRVQFRGGWLTQFYPDAVADVPGMAKDGYKNFGPIKSNTVGRLSWKIREIGSDGQGPPTTEHVWTAPRAVDCAYVQTEKGELERFLFYRGVGNIDAPLRVARDRTGTNLLLSAQLSPELKPSEPLRVEWLWLADIRGNGTSAFRQLPAVSLSGDARKTLATTPAAFNEKEYSLNGIERLRTAMHEALVKEGLFADETDALLNTWKLSYFESAGLRLFFLVPRTWTDHCLPLQISVPSEVKRVMVGRIEIVTPEQRTLLQKIASRSIGGMDEEQKRLHEICYSGFTGVENRDQLNKVWEGKAPLMSLGMRIPETYQAYIDLGRFRNALILDEQERRPSDALKHFIQINRLEAYKVPGQE